MSCGRSLRLVGATVLGLSLLVGCGNDEEHAAEPTRTATVSDQPESGQSPDPTPPKSVDKAAVLSENLCDLMPLNALTATIGDLSEPTFQTFDGGPSGGTTAECSVTNYNSAKAGEPSNFSIYVFAESPEYTRSMVDGLRDAISREPEGAPKKSMKEQLKRLDRDGPAWDETFELQGFRCIAPTPGESVTDTDVVNGVHATCILGPEMRLEAILNTLLPVGSEADLGRALLAEIISKLDS